MCIIFFYQCEIWKEDGYRLVLASNRDEVWDRPSHPADFWGPDGCCISGLDQTPGKEGGSWLAMNKKGKVAALLNITGSLDSSKKGRGKLVCDYVSGKDDIMEYGKKVLDERHQYNGFNLVLFDLGKEEDSLTVKPLYINNAPNYSSCVPMRTLPANTFFGLSNSPIEYPYRKVEIGRSLFGKLVCQYPTVKAKEHLIKKLMELMQDQTPLLPDPVLENRTSALGFSPLRTQQHSAINVWSPIEKYGTRTTTLILVDGEGNVDYVERNIDLGDNDVQVPSIVEKTYSMDLQ